MAIGQCGNVVFNQNTMETIKKITLVGAGNLATQLAIALHKKGVQIVQVYSRTEQSAKTLAQLVDADYTNQIAAINTQTDCMIFAITDTALPVLLHQLDLKHTNVVHTAGSVAMDIFKEKANNYGVFYPLQTFSKHRSVDFSIIPICIEANNLAFAQNLQHLAKQISTFVQLVDSKQREKLHLAAVFACNFTNHMYRLAEDILHDSQLDFELLQPLIAETAEKVQHISPQQAQTGPAVRFDKAIISHHLSLLAADRDKQKIYSFVSDSIFNNNKK